MQFHCIEHTSFSVGVSNEKQLLSHDLRLQLGAKKVVESCRHAVKSGRETIILASNKTQTRYLMTSRNYDSGGPDHKTLGIPNPRTVILSDLTDFQNYETTIKLENSDILAGETGRII